MTSFGNNSCTLQYDTFIIFVNKSARVRVPHWSGKEILDLEEALNEKMHDNEI
jgi:hypothetical protein